MSHAKQHLVVIVAPHVAQRCLFTVSYRDAGLREYFSRKNLPLHSCPHKVFCLPVSGFPQTSHVLLLILPVLFYQRSAKDLDILCGLS